MPIHDEVETIIKSIDKLPPIPEIARRVLVLADSPDANLKEIVDVIKYDQAITSNCLKLCNSSYFGLREKVYSIDDALVMIGLQNLVKIVLVNCSGLSLYADGQEGYNLKPGELWKHSVACATISQLLLKENGHQEDSVLFTAALLHDIGKLILDKFIVAKSEDLQRLAQEQGLTFHEAEKKFFGINHAELGGIIAKNWGFPQTLINSISNHHQSMSGKIIPNLEAWVRLSNLVYYAYLMHGISFHHNDIDCHIKEEILLQFKLSQMNINNILTALPGELEKAYDLINLPEE